MSDLMRGVVQQHVEKDATLRLLGLIEGIAFHLIEKGIVNGAELSATMEGNVQRHIRETVELLLERLHKTGGK